MKIVSLILKLLILLILFYIAINNLNNVEFYWSITHKIEVPLIFLLFIFFVIGVICGLLSIAGKILHLRTNISSLKKKLNKINNSLN